MCGPGQGLLRPAYFVCVGQSSSSNDRLALAGTDSQTTCGQVTCVRPPCLVVVCARAGAETRPTAKIDAMIVFTFHSFDFQEPGSWPTWSREMFADCLQLPALSSFTRQKMNTRGMTHLFIVQKSTCAAGIAIRTGIRFFIAGSCPCVSRDRIGKDELPCARSNAGEVAIGGFRTPTTFHRRRD